MTGDKGKNVSRLFIMSPWSRKKGSGNRQSPRIFRRFRAESLPVCLLLLLALATVFLAYPMPDEYNISLQLGEIADRNVKADRDLMILDQVATNKKRVEARRNVPPVFDLDDRAAQEAYERLHRVFYGGWEILNTLPIEDPPNWPSDTAEVEAKRELNRLRELFFRDFDIDPREEIYEILVENRFSPHLQKAVFQVIAEFLTDGIVDDKPVLLHQASDAGIVVRRILSGQETHVLYAMGFHSLSEARRLVRDRVMRLGNEFNPRQTKAVLALAQALLRPNLSFNSKETEERRMAAAREVGPVYFQVKKGEMIVRIGERVDRSVRQKLSALSEKANRGDWFKRAVGVYMLAVVFLVVSCLVGLRFTRGILLKDRDLAFLAAQLLICLFMAYAAAQVGEAMNRGWAGVDMTSVLFLTPLASGSMIVTIFLGPVTGLFFAVISSALSALIFDQSLVLFFYTFLGASAGLSGLIRVRERGAIIKSGLVVGLVNMGYDSGPEYDQSDDYGPAGTV